MPLLSRRFADLLLREAIATNPKYETDESSRLFLLIPSLGNQVPGAGEHKGEPLVESVHVIFPAPDEFGKLPLRLNRIQGVHNVVQSSTSWANSAVEQGIGRVGIAQELGHVHSGTVHILFQCSRVKTGFAIAVGSRLVVHGPMA